jgi:hypothetical protein
MKPLATVCILSLSLAGGALVHHMVDSGRDAFQARKIPGNTVAEQTRPGRSREEIAGLADELLAWEKEDTLQWNLLDKKLSSVLPEEFPRLLGALADRHEFTWERGNALREALLEYAAAANPKALLAFAGQEQSKVPLKAVVEHCYRADPGATIAAIRRFQAVPAKDKAAKHTETQELINTAFRDECGRDPAAALATAEQNGFLENQTVAACFGAAMDRWAGVDAARALAFALDHPALRDDALRRWTADDPDAAIAWMRGRPENQRQVDEDGASESFLFDGSALKEGLYRYAESHPKEAQRFADQLSSERERNEFYQHHAVGMSQEPVDVAAAWVKTLPEDLRTDACLSLTESLMAENPAAAAAICAQLPPLAENFVAAHAVNEWGQRDPAAASQFLQSSALPASVRDRELPNVVRNWLIIDRAAAQQFIASQPPSEAMGRILLQSTGILEDGDSNSARDLAMTLPDVSLRIGACRRIVESEFHWDDQNAVQVKAAREQWLAGIPDAAVRNALSAPGGE